MLTIEELGYFIYMDEQEKKQQLSQELDIEHIGNTEDENDE